MVGGRRLSVGHERNAQQVPKKAGNSLKHSPGEEIEAQSNKCLNVAKDEELDGSYNL